MKTTIILSAVIMLFMTSCREKIELELDDASSRIVIEGCFTNEAKAHEVHITRSLGYLDGNQSPAVTDAEVKITDGTETFHLTHAGNGVYRTEANVAGITGHKYTLVVNADGVEYTASEVMNPCTPIDSLAISQANVPLQPGVIWEPGLKYYNVGVFCQEPGNQTNYYMFDIYRNNVLFSDTINKKFISDDGFINGSYIYGMNVMQIDAVPGDSVKLVMYSVTKEFYNFMYGVIQSGMSGNPFAGQPSNLPTNVSGGALGYFRVSSETSQSGVIR